MTIQSAIIAAKSSYNWSIVPHEPTTVSVRYRMKGGTLLETDFDLYTDDPETELADLWERLCGELCCHVLDDRHARPGPNHGGDG